MNRALFAVVIYTFLESSLVSANQQDVGRSNVHKLNARQIIASFGFPSEGHTIKTRDGYLLELHRIPWGRKGPSTRRPDLPPVLIQHGILCSSATHFIIGPDDALPFLLADMGFDVWMGNIRGNTYSRGHVTLNPDKFEFWNYTWHESGLNDVSAEIDFVLDYTKKPKLVYIGHSMGTTMYFVLMSMRPEYNKKIELGMMMAPVAYISHTKCPLFQIFAAPGTIFFDITLHFGAGEITPKSSFMEFLGSYFCDVTGLHRDICGSVIHLITGDDPQAYDTEFMDVLLSHFPQGYSIKAVNHYTQLILSDKFRMYDYGNDGNMRQYGRLTPPDYNITNIKAPMIFYAARSDYLGDLVDVKRLADQLPAVKELYVVPYSKFGHFDFLFGRTVKEDLNDKMIKDLMTHLKKL